MKDWMFDSHTNYSLCCTACREWTLKIILGTYREPLQQGLANYGPWAKSCPPSIYVFINKVLLWHCHAHSFTCIYGCFCTATMLLTSWNRNPVAHKTSTTYYLPFIEKVFQPLQFQVKFFLSLLGLFPSSPGIPLITSAHPSPASMLLLFSNNQHLRLFDGPWDFICLQNHPHASSPQPIANCAGEWTRSSSFATIQDKLWGIIGAPRVPHCTGVPQTPLQISPLPVSHPSLSAFPHSLAGFS